MHTTQIARHRPAFFEAVREKAHTRWDQLESDPELAGPWRLLFAQVQSPRHVLSELLQNADDAGARSASASIENGAFVFEHDGEDFDEDQFSSLCRFGFSNKRKLHTIGFRGIGFKSVFSLGENVEVVTPTLAVRFHKRRFSEPIWMGDAAPCRNTVIRVAIQDDSRAAELRANLDEWARSAISLAFFNRIRKLVIDGAVIQRKRIGSGPVAGSEAIEISDTASQALHLFRSPEEPFPADAIEEISSERNLDELNLQPCRVELVVGLQDDSRLYVVLPSEIRPNLPFSCNAPFIQDPARTGLKDPAISPTNRWLLRRAGKLAGQVMTEWLGNRDMPLSERVKAYCLLPTPPYRSDAIGDDCAREVCQGFRDATSGVPVLLTAGGTVAEPSACLVPPSALYSVWNAGRLLTCFGNGEKYVLSGDVPFESRNALQRWGWIAPLPAERVLERLRSGERPPKPKDWDCLLNLWAFVQSSIPHDYSGQGRRTIRMVPAEGKDVLFTADEVVRLASNWRLVNDGDWEFLSQFMVAADGEWFAAIGNESGRTSGQADYRRRCEWETLRAVGLDVATPADTILARAASALFSRPQVCLAEVVRFTHIMAAMKVRAREDFKYFTRDGQLRGLAKGVIWDDRGEIESLVPSEWAAAHLLHECYSRGSVSCSREAWAEWAQSDKSGLEAAICPRKTVRSVWGRWNVEDFLRSRRVAAPSSYPYKRDHFSISDYDFESDLSKHMEHTATSDPAVWSRVLFLLLQDPSLSCLQQVKAVVRQDGNTYSEMIKCNDIPAAWLVRFQGLRCMPDTHGNLRDPAELLMRTPSTEPLMHVEPFVKAEYDNPGTRPLLKLLGVRDTPSGPEKLLDRIRALATVKAPPVHEVCKWYEALDRLLARSRQEDLAEARAAFREDRLILTEDNDWAAVDEAFLLANEEDVPGAPLVHSSARELSMWSRLGVAERPTVDLVIRWFQGIESGQKLDGPDLKRIRTLLARYAVRVWEDCGHWLSLDNTWTPTANLRFRVTMQALTKFGDLFPTFKARTANLQMLSADVCDNYPFAAVKNLGTEIEYRVTERQYNLPAAMRRPWLLALARGLGRARLDQDQVPQVRTAANRLGRTVWQLFHTLRVMPYIEGTPAGQAQSPDVFWDDETLYVKDRPLVRVFDALVAEIARPFGLAKIAEVIKACVERDDSFVNEYIEGTFGFEALDTASDDGVGDDTSEGHQTTVDENASRGGEGSGETELNEMDTAEHDPGAEVEEPASDSVDSDADPEDADQPTTPIREHQPVRITSPSLIARYAKARGYRWDDLRQRYVDPDENWLQKCEGSFNWERYSSQGEVVCRYWISKQCLANGGIQVASDLWELVRKNPSQTGLVLEDGDGKPHELGGAELVQMVDSGRLGLFPANYRLRTLKPT